MLLFDFTTEMPVPQRALFDYHAAPGAFERLVPPWERIEIVARRGSIKDGDMLAMRIHKGPFSVLWVAEHMDYEEGRRFADLQVKGPFRYWRHEHLFNPIARDCSLLEDRVEFQVSPLMGGRFFGEKPAEKALERMFAFRHRRTFDDLHRHHRYADRPRKTVLLCGKPTSLSQTLAAFLSVGGHRVFQLVYRESNSGHGRFGMIPFTGDGFVHPLEETDAVIDSGKPLSGVPPEEGPQADLHFLARAYKTAGTPPPLWIHLKGRHRDLDRWVEDPAIDFSKPRKKVDSESAREQAFEQIRPKLTREVFLYLGHLLEPDMRLLVNLQMRMESYLFLKNDAKTPRFAWVGREDAVFAVLFCLYEEGVQGDVSVAVPGGAERNQLQEALLNRDFTAYTKHRILKVLPWAKPGLPPLLDDELSKIPNLQNLGFQYGNADFNQALAYEFGEPTETGSPTT